MTKDGLNNIQRAADESADVYRGPFQRASWSASEGRTVEQSVRTFEYRQPRMLAHFPLEFRVNGEIHRGTCTDVSDGGIRATFLRPVLVGNLGKLLLLHPEHHFEVEAVVAHLEGEDAGLTFALRTGEDRRLCERFVEMAVGLHDVT